MLSRHVAVQRLYRTLLGLARGVERGETPLGLAEVVDDTTISGANGLLDEGQAWRTLVSGHISRGRETTRPAAE